MSLFTIFTLVFTQLRIKWGRTLLSAMGIMIGVWAILLTVSLSTGLSDKLIVAFNSQSISRLVQFYKTEPEITKFSEFNNTKFVPKSYDYLENTVDEVSVPIASYDVSDTMQIKIQKPSPLLNSKVVERVACVNEDIALSVYTADNGISEEVVEQERMEYTDRCFDMTIARQPFDLFLANNKNNWYGTQQPPQQDEIVVCFECNKETPLNKFLGVDNPEDMVGKTIKLEYATLPTTETKDVPKDITETFPTTPKIKQTVVREYTIQGVYDDRNSNQLNLLNTLNSFGYISEDGFAEAVTQQKPELNQSTIGYVEHNIFLESFEDLDQSVKDLQDSGNLTISLGQFFASSVKTIFQVLTVVLGLFALIALIASVFGIVNVMTISVLERQKEIGILKSLGSPNSAIFWIFLIESTFLGLLGWLLGVLLTWASNKSISSVFDAYLGANETIKYDLAALNINSFELGIPTNTLLLTLVLSVIFTIISGLIPAIQAARQNPTEVLRSE
jgi:ABC-type antimicrobial peptide transport system permease subunit